jgi:hypothetical protein
MADVHPLKYVYNAKGEVIALAEFEKNDTIPARYLNLSTEVDGGALTDTFSHLIETVDGGTLTDVYLDNSVEYSGGEI